MEKTSRMDTTFITLEKKPTPQNVRSKLTSKVVNGIPSSVGNHIKSCGFFVSLSALVNWTYVASRTTLVLSSEKFNTVKKLVK
jgi:hypothetical protein